MTDDAQICCERLCNDKSGERYFVTVFVTVLGRDHRRRSQAARQTVSGPVTKLIQSAPKRDIILLTKG
jgi:hypothetical protein